ncbi:DNA adenine methylase [Arthrobacter subterraneus]|uniref:DNA adenine methylase n=1 Tax=Arthrobacter subterraneus TaxID=335973 RepID=A0A1G8MX40_9MICC|nr:DNA adenine methylase [Arthrobacter subterraneus]SDI72464.1 DNA adenine methylase [Arthrobacter subterraneus]
MPVTPSPLRYPGGKSALFDLTSQLLRDNQLNKRTYAEPFAGGAGLALRLLFEGAARRIVLNDLDAGIYSFWDAVLNDHERFIDTMRSTPITVEEWLVQREVHRAATEPSFELAFATFFLNRTNRSGVVKGGVIGGLDQQGAYKIDCRYNLEDLAAKIKRIGRYRDDIELFRHDGEDFLKEIDTRDRVVFFIDPPYYLKGSGLYTNFYVAADHQRLAASIHSLENPWLLTYDNTPEITRLYPRHRRHTFDLNYSVGVKRVGTELMVTSSHFSQISSSRLRCESPERVCIPLYGASSIRN